MKENLSTTNSQIELPSVPPESHFQPEQNNLKPLIPLGDPQIPHEAKDKLSLLLEKEYDSNVSKSPMLVGRTNIPTAGPHIAHKTYPFLLKYQKLMDEEIRLLENAGCISKCLSPWVAQVIIIPKTQTLKSSKTTVSLSFRLPVTQ